MPIHPQKGTYPKHNIPGTRGASPVWSRSSHYARFEYENSPSFSFRLQNISVSENTSDTSTCHLPAVHADYKQSSMAIPIYEGDRLEKFILSASAFTVHTAWTVEGGRGCKGGLEKNEFLITTGYIQISQIYSLEWILRGKQPMQTPLWVIGVHQPSPEVVLTVLGLTKQPKIAKSDILEMMGL